MCIAHENGVQEVYIYDLAKELIQCSTISHVTSPNCGEEKLGGETSRHPSADGSRGAKLFASTWPARNPSADGFAFQA